MSTVDNYLIDNIMPINVAWYDTEKTIVLLDFVEPHITTWGEYHKAVDEAIALVNSVEHHVGLIFNADKAPMPPGAPVEEMRRAAERMPDKILHVVTVIARNPFENLVLSIFQRLTRSLKPTYTVATVEEAVKLLRDTYV